ncbi:response regulator transcription factor [Pandoraea pnomenusa]|uniref:response regulator transcription factor n=1 Tax=Pandoraea pnomenusa TaxID=93220 RepID=UPI0033419A3A
MRIAFVEDDDSQVEMIRHVLEALDFSWEHFTDAAAFMSALQHTHFDMLILDWELPDMSGLELARWVRREMGDLPPILFVTNRTLEDDMVLAIEAGADDYMTKPVRQGEMTARIHAILRRALPEASHDEDSIELGPYKVQTRAKRISLDGAVVSVSPREFDLVLFLFRNIGKTIKRETMEKAVWGRTIGKDSRTLDTHLSRLRVKLALRPENGVKLVSVYGKGFRLECVAPDEPDAMGKSEYAQEER